MSARELALQIVADEVRRRGMADVCALGGPAEYDELIRVTYGTWSAAVAALLRREIYKRKEER